jgi:hypothetical protein
MSVEAGLRAFILGDAAVVQEIGNRMHINEIPLESKRPALVFRRVSTALENHMAGPALLQRCWVTVGVRAERYEQAERIAELVRNRIEGYQGAAGAVTFQAVKWQNRISGWDSTLDTHAVDDDYAVWTAV